MDKVYRCFHIGMGTKKMADVLYAVIMTNARITSTFTLGHKYTRSQNSRNGADIMIEIDEEKIPRFEEMTEIHLQLPPKGIMN